MSLGFAPTENPYGWLNMPPEAREEAFWIALDQCTCASAVWEIVQRPSSRKYLAQFSVRERPMVMLRISAVARRLPYDEIAAPVWVVADARPALPALFDFGV
jgi:hypothetical protein